MSKPGASQAEIVGQNRSVALALALSLMLSLVACSTTTGISPSDGGGDGQPDLVVDGAGDASTDATTDTTTDLGGDGAMPVGPWLPLQLNDVSILFPLAANPDELAAGSLSAGASGARGVLLPEALYDRLGHITGSSGSPPPGGTGEALYASLKVVALRLDPCFAALQPDPHGQGCKNQVRLVMQQVTAMPASPAVAFDSALHVFYTVSREELLVLAQAIAGLRVSAAPDQRLGGLAPHPLMVREGLTGPTATGIKNLIVKYAGQNNLTRVTKLSASNAGFSWTFDGFDVSSAAPPVVVPMVIPTLSPAAGQQMFFRGFGLELAGTFNPATTSVDNLTPLADVQTAQQLTAAARSTAFAALVRIDHPGHNSPDTIDCASCHLATPLSVLVAGPDFSLRESADPAAFAPDGRWVLPSEMAPTFNTTGAFNIHAFSYVERSPGINQRTVNESAAVVAYLNDQAGAFAADAGAGE